ncbi:ribosomal RNA-processing protein 7-domain-containing protein [Phellopilus nigrolimitatus]|nr:ribosomal RNA-processing protein 7-domain-containing protein [Phellopilus nigrolimitatus]
MDSPDTISGFTVLPAIYTKSATHILYGKAHVGSKKADSTSKVLPNGRTLFLVNVPPDATERELTLFFKPAGVVEKIVFDQNAAEEEALNSDSSSEEEEADAGEGMQVDGTMGSGERPAKRRRKDKERGKKPVVEPLPSVPLRTLRKTGRTAYVVFLDSASLSAALSPPHKPRPWPRSAEPSGLAHYKALHDSLRPPLDAVRAHAESAIALFDYEEERRKQKFQYTKGEAIVDEDGFTLVTRGGSYGQTPGGGVGIATKRFHETGETNRGGKKKKEKAEKDSFYAFQKHERKRQELVDLKKKWSEDLEKVKKLKETRSFRPY